MYVNVKNQFDRTIWLHIPTAVCARSATERQPFPGAKFGSSHALHAETFEGMASIYWTLASIAHIFCWPTKWRKVS
jgi:hypothetical protein